MQELKLIHVNKRGPKDIWMLKKNWFEELAMCDETPPVLWPASHEWAGLAAVGVTPTVIYTYIENLHFVDFTDFSSLSNSGWLAHGNCKLSDIHTGA